MAQLAQIIRPPGPKEQKKTETERQRLRWVLFRFIFFKQILKYLGNVVLKLIQQHQHPAKFSAETYFMAEASRYMCYVYCLGDDCLCTHLRLVHPTCFLLPVALPSLVFQASLPFFISPPSSLIRITEEEMDQNV